MEDYGKDENYRADEAGWKTKQPTSVACRTTSKSVGRNLHSAIRSEFRLQAVPPAKAGTPNSYPQSSHGLTESRRGGCCPVSRKVSSGRLDWPWFSSRSQSSRNLPPGSASLDIWRSQSSSVRLVGEMHVQDFQSPIQLLQSRKFRGRLVNFRGELLAVGAIAGILKRHQKRRQLPLLDGAERRQFLFQHFNAHGFILPPTTPESTFLIHYS